MGSRSSRAPSRWARLANLKGAGYTLARFAHVAQLDRALASGARGRRFESCRAYLVVHRTPPSLVLVCLGLLACGGGDLEDERGFAFEQGDFAFHLFEQLVAQENIESEVADVENAGAVAAAFGEGDEAGQDLGQVLATALPGPGHVGGEGEEDEKT